MAVTMQDIAERLNVCRALVSAVLNEKKGFRVSEKTRKRVLAVAQELSYHKNMLAASTRTGIVKTLAVITPFSNKRPEMLDGIIEAAMAFGFDIKIFSDNHVENVISSIIENRIVYVISLSTDRKKREQTAQLASRNSLKLIFHFESGLLDFPVLNIDFACAGALSVEYLAGLGHRRIAAVSGPVNKEMLYKKKYLAAFKQGMKQAGLKVPKGFADTTLDFQENVDCLLDLPAGRRPTAICCISDAIAYYVFRAAAQRGIALPEELSLIGFGNFAYSDLAFVPLTTFDEFLTERGRISVEILLGKTELKHDADGYYLLKPKLIVRESAATTGQKRPR